MLCSFAIHCNQHFYLTQFYVFFVNILKEFDFAGFKLSPTCYASSSITCDNVKDCDDNSDEMGCQCPGDRPFECDCYQPGGCTWGWGFGCISQSQVCDEDNNCGDWSDEKFCLSTKLYCRNDECVERSKVNDGKVDMTGGYDEFICNATLGHKCGCIPGNDNCTVSGKCIPQIWIGDAKDDCNASHSDEPCKAIKIRCKNCEVIINRCPTNESKVFFAS